MSYTFAGQLFGLLCADCSEPVANTTIRMYRSRRSVAPSASEGELLTLTDDAVQARSEELPAEVESDEHGAFTVQLDDERYHGEPFQIHAYCTTVPPYRSRFRFHLPTSVSSVESRTAALDELRAPSPGGDSLSQGARSSSDAGDRCRVLPGGLEERQRFSSVSPKYLQTTAVRSMT